MAKAHPVHAFQASLEAQRLKAIEALAEKGGAISPHDLRDLAIIQAALVAVREEIAAHGGKVGWGGEAELA